MSLATEAKKNSIRTLKLHVWHCYTVGLTAKEIIEAVESAIKRTPNGKQALEQQAIANGTGTPYSDEEHHGTA